MSYRKSETSSLTSFPDQPVVDNRTKYEKMLHDLNPNLCNEIFASDLYAFSIPTAFFLLYSFSPHCNRETLRQLLESNNWQITQQLYGSHVAYIHAFLGEKPRETMKSQQFSLTELTNNGSGFCVVSTQAEKLRSRPNIYDQTIINNSWDHSKSDHERQKTV